MDIGLNFGSKKLFQRFFCDFLFFSCGFNQFLHVCSKIFKKSEKSDWCALDGAVYQSKCGCLPAN